MNEKNILLSMTVKLSAVSASYSALRDSPPAGAQKLREEFMGKYAVVYHFYKDHQDVLCKEPRVWQAVKDLAILYAVVHLEATTVATPEPPTRTTVKTTTVSRSYHIKV